MPKNSILPLIRALRPGQWIKNLLLFAAIIFNGQLFNKFFFIRSIEGFIVFCAISSASYLLNDIVDEPLDKKHPIKKKRPIPSGALPKARAFEVMIILSILGLSGAFAIRFSFFLITAGFFLLHVLYSLYFKRFAILDILSIALSFALRAFAGELLTGFHLPIWLTFTVIFLSLFIASSKRRSEFVLEGSQTRPALQNYHEKLLDFYVSTFATAVIVTYAMFTFIEGVPKFTGGILSPMLAAYVPELLARKWLMITVPFVIIGIMRYAQLIFEKSLGEQPERLVTSDIPLVATILGWGVSVVLIIYII
jgi:4-hydroxybenzoate polyprenyltransferase